MDDDIAACAGIVQKGDPDRFLAIMSAPLALREKLFPLYAMNVEVSRAPWVTQESMIAEMRLQWWHDALEEIAKDGQVRRHEVVTPLAAILNPAQARRLMALVTARRWDIYKDPFEDEAHFQSYLRDTSGQLLVVAAELAGAGDSASVERLGLADGLARWFQAVPALEAQGRVPMVDGRPKAVADLARQGLGNLRDARRSLGRQPAEVAAVLRSTCQTKQILDRVVARPERVANGDVNVSGFRRKISLLWKSVIAGW